MRRSRLTQGRISERHKAVTTWTFLCAGGASFALAAQMFRSLVG